MSDSADSPEPRPLTAEEAATIHSYLTVCRAFGVHHTLFSRDPVTLWQAAESRIRQANEGRALDVLLGTPLPEDRADVQAAQILCAAPENDVDARRDAIRQAHALLVAAGLVQP